ncbi:DNA replication terminus site-binding protein [Psychromonas sp.]|uniref:DNA replication terminus site-binding protein n=1 Tax=Psychromonas sp. TaxID=1884585 RepID=UPI00356AF6E1
MDQQYYYIKNSEQLKEDLLTAVADVRQGLADFSAVLLLQDKEKQRQSVVFSLIDRADDQIEFDVLSFFAESAVHETLHFIKSFELQKDSSQDTKKLAGFIQTSLPVEVLDLHITRINAAKDKCKKIITSIKDVDTRKQADKRFYFVHHICGFTHFVTNELYRHLVHILEPVDSIYFGLEKHNKHSNVFFPKAKATLRNKDDLDKAIVRKKHNSLPIFLAENSRLQALNKNGKKEAIRYSYK